MATWVTHRPDSGQGAHAVPGGHTGHVPPSHWQVDFCPQLARSVNTPHGSLDPATGPTW